MEKIQSALLQEEYYRGQAGDLPLYFIPKRGFLKKYALLGVPYGSVDIEFEWKGENRKVPTGIAHFLEHLLFEQEEGNAFTLFPSLGADSNAYTSHTQTAYLFSCTENFYESLGLLLKFSHLAYFTEEMVAKEKGVISEEIDMGEDSAGWRVFDQLLKALFVHHPLREEIAGTKESIYEITPQHLHLIHQAFYRPSGMALIVVGDLDVQELKGFLQKFYSEFSLSFPTESPGRIYPPEPDQAGQAEISSQMDISQPYFLLGYKRIHRPGKPALEIIREQTALNFGLELLFGKSSPLYTKLYDQHLIDSGFSYSHTAEKDLGYTLLGGETRDPKGLEEVLLKVLEEGKTQGFYSERFEQIKNKSLGRFLCSLDLVGFTANEFLNNAFWDFNPFDYPQVVDNLSLDEMVAIFREHFGQDNRTTSIVWPG